MRNRDLAAAGAVAAAAVLALWAVDTGPNPPIVIAIALAASAAVWFFRRTSAELSPGPPALEQLDDPSPPPDLRTTTLRQALAAGNADEHVSERIYVQLVAAIDDELWHTYGIDRSVSPEASRAVLPQQLDQFVSDPEAGRRMNVRTLERIVTQIEHL